MDKQTRILVVDDELGIREGCKRILTEEGYVVEEAEDGNIGLQKVNGYKYDLILVDLMMPGIGGLDLIQKIHKIDPEIILVVITGYATIETAVEATKRGAYDYLSKPFTPETLAAVVKRGLEKRELRLEALRLSIERDKRLLELINEQSRIRTIIGCMADGVLVTNLERQLVLWNKSAVKMLKLTGIEKSNKQLDHYIKDTTIVNALEEVLDSIDTNFSMISQEISIDKDKTILMANIAAVRDEGGNILGIVTVLRDISKLKEIDKIKSQFVSMVAHELRAPLAAIEGWLEVILSGEAGSTEKQNQKWLQRAKERAHSLLALVNDLLVINSIDAGKVALKKQSVNLSEMIPKIVDVLKSEAIKRNISIRLDFPKSLSIIQADIKDMEKLFTNLINNAIKYNVDGGSIIIMGSEDASYVCIRIKDTGIGIAKAHLGHIFEDFFRIENKQTKDIPGTGLGLTISKKIIDSHFGHFDVKSQLGKGSTFSVFLPLINRIN